MMRHEQKLTVNNQMVQVSDTDATNPTVTLRTLSSQSQTSVYLDAKELDDLIITLQFYRSRLEFTELK